MTIELTGFYPRQYYPEPLRLVRYWDEEQKREFVFLTNAIHLSSLQVAELYKKPLANRAFLQMAEAAPQNQEVLGHYRECCSDSIYAAICAYCLVAIIQYDMKLDRSTYEILQILSISLTDRTHLRDLLDKTKFQNDKERFGLNGPSLFNF